MLEERIKQLKKEIIEYAGIVESMVEGSVYAVASKDEKALNSIINTLEPKANAYEIEIDELCLTSIAQFQPRAKSLRTIMMIYKMGNDFERMGDHAVNIAESVLYLIKNSVSANGIDDIINMGKVTVEALKDSVNAFINEDTGLAKAVCERDKMIDDFRTLIIKNSIELMSRLPSSIEYFLHISRISSNLERIADLSTNICEDIIFMVEGKVIKHHAQDWKL